MEHDGPKNTCIGSAWAAPASRGEKKDEGGVCEIMTIAKLNEKPKVKLENRLLPVEKRVLWDVVILCAVSLACFFLPFATYRFQSTNFSMPGLRFLTGTSIMQGSVRIAPNVMLLIVVALLVVAIVLALLFPKFRKVRLPATLMLLIGLAQLILVAVFSQNISGLLTAKTTGVGYGLFITGILGLVLMARAAHILYRHRSLTMLDFMILPGALYFLINNYLPMLFIFVAFKEVDYSVGIWESPWVGLNNFKFLFATADAWIITRNTLLYNIVFIILGNVMGILVGMLLFEILNKFFKRFYQTAILLPQLISMIIVAYIVFAFLSNEAGFINKSILGEGNEINFYAERWYWPFILTFVNIWKGLGYNSIIYLSAIVGIDQSLYEAACVDGCGKLKQIFRITLPLLKPTIITLVIMQVGRIFYSDFGLFLQVPMNNGILFPVTQTIDTYVYRALMQMNRIGNASAASVYQAIVGFIIVVVVNGIVRKTDKENAMF